MWMVIITIFYFYDYYSKYNQIYFLKFKSKVLNAFINFHHLVENFFSYSIKSFQSDWGGEFQALTSYLCDNGITQRVAYPKTPEQNDYAKRKHRYIVETGQALLQHSNIPHDYWHYVF